MKPAAVLLAAHRDRGLEDDARRIALRHHVTLEQVYEPTHAADVVRARHAIWEWQVSELGSVGTVARLWGVDRSSLLAADDAKTSIAWVLLDELRQGHHFYRFSYYTGREKPFAIANVETGRITSYRSYEAARVVWQQALDLAGVTFRAVAALPELAGGAS